MIREIVFVDREKVGFIMADDPPEGRKWAVDKQKFIHVGDLVKLEDGTYEVAAISNGDGTGDYGDLYVFRLNEGLPDILSPFDVTKIYREVKA